MANINVDWEVEGIISPNESVTKMLKVIGEKGKSDSGTFWDWDGRVRIVRPLGRRVWTNRAIAGTSLVILVILGKRG